VIGSTGLSFVVMRDLLCMVKGFLFHDGDLSCIIGYSARSVRVTAKRSKGDCKTQ